LTALLFVLLALGRDIHTNDAIVQRQASFLAKHMASIDSGIQSYSGVYLSFAPRREERHHRLSKPKPRSHQGLGCQATVIQCSAPQAG
jgi:hypothetical protein